MSFDEETENITRIITLKNAVEHDGKAMVDTVIAKIAASKPNLRSDLTNVIPDIKILVEKINSLSLADQKAFLEEIAPEELKERKKVYEAGQSQLPPLQGATMGNVVTRFPPEPNGYPHLGHAKAAIIDEQYARLYKGKLILRFDDTNPVNEKLEYYEAINEGLEWLGVKPNVTKNTSDDIQLLYEYGKKLIMADGAYVCTCPQRKIHDLRANGLPCECRKDPAVAIERFRKVLDGYFGQNDAIVRFKGDMSDQNTTMRDPTLFRILEANHPKLGNRIRVWPTYDFAAPIEDSLDGVTHAMRTKEYELRNELYFAILDRLGLRKPIMIEFSRLEFDGIPVSKRKIKPLIEGGIIKSWDDPRLPTLMAMRKRGFLPEAIRQFVLSLGMTRAETKPPFEALEAFNRKIIDPQCIRLFFVNDPVELHIKNINSSNEIILKNHPNKDFGFRKVKVSNSFYISNEDAIKLNVGDEIRLMELYNIKIVEIKSEDHKKLLIANSIGDQLKQAIPKIQWVANDNIVPFKVLIARQLYIGEVYNIDSLKISEGFAEAFVSTLEYGTIFQFVRFGFCRLDENNTAIFSHR
ncbi:MAG TPA: glutamate--tRNA ligase [Nitrososphaeraceae archaeon]|nr:glutamate--tRNA ligase [Nitrososphaeraceae archaeon]